uniref:Uncharacterized protein n=1 Tax=Romanomermis culicivorax TaxID=13658 RepID=A0A915I3K1_ROMCU
MCHIYKANEKGLVSKIASKSFEKIIDVKSASYESKYFLVIAHQNSQNTNFVTWIDANSGEEVKGAGCPISTEELSSVEEIFPVVFSRSGATHVFRTIVLREDYSLSAFQSSYYLMQYLAHPLWIREEALSQILSVELVDLPLSEAQASVESEFSTLNQNVISMFAKRLTTQAIQIQRGFMRLVNESLYYASAFASGSSPGEWMSIAKKVSSPLSFKDTPFERDYFNLHKVVVVATKVGKVLYMFYKKSY